MHQIFNTNLVLLVLEGLVFPGILLVIGYWLNEKD